MGIKIENGKILDAEGNELGSTDDILDTVREQYGLLTEDQAVARTNNAVQKRINEFKEKLKAAEESVTATESEKNQLKMQIQTLEEANMTAEQRAAEQAKKERVGVEQERDVYKKRLEDAESRYRNEVATNRLMAAASKVKAINPETFVAILRTNEEWVEGKGEDGKVVSEPKYRMKKLNPTTNEYEQGLFSSSEAAEILATNEKYLVAADGKSGLGHQGEYVPGNPRTFTRDQIRQMSDKQLQEAGLLPTM